MSPAVSFDRVSIVFGDDPESALPAMDAGKDRARVQEETGQVLGVHNCSLDVARGEILVLMGLSGSGKSTLLRAVNGLNPVVRGQVRINDGSWTADVVGASAADLLKIRRDAPRSTNSWPWSVCPTGATTWSRNCRAGCSSASASPAPSPPMRRSC